MPKAEQVNLQRTLALVSFFYFTYSAGSACLFPFLTLYLRQLGLSATQAGVVMGLKVFVALWAAPLWSSCAVQHGRRRVILMIAIFMTIAANLSLTLLPPADHNLYFAFCDQANKSIVGNQELSNKSAVDNGGNYESATTFLQTSQTQSSALVQTTPSRIHPHLTSAPVNSIHAPFMHLPVTEVYQSVITKTTRHQSPVLDKQPVNFQPTKGQPNSIHSLHTAPSPNLDAQSPRPGVHKQHTTPRPGHLLPISNSQDDEAPTKVYWSGDLEENKQDFPKDPYHDYDSLSKSEWIDSTHFSYIWKPQEKNINKPNQVTKTPDQRPTTTNNMRKIGGLKWSYVQEKRLPNKGSSYSSNTRQRTSTSTSNFENQRDHYANFVKRSLSDDQHQISDNDQLPRSLGSAQKTLIKTVGHFLEYENIIFIITLLIMVIGESLACPVDKICDSSLHETLDSVDELDKYRRHHVPSIISYGLFALIITVIVDSMDCQLFLQTSNFVIHFYLFAGLLSVTFLLAFFYPIPAPQKATRKPRFCKGLKLLVSDPHNVVVTLTMIVTGALVSNIHNFLFWRIQDLGGSEVVMGVSVLVAVGSHIPALFLTGWLNRKISQLGTIVLAVLSLAVRLLYFTFLWTPWAVVPIEVLCAFSQQALWETVTSYGEQISPPAMDRSVKSILNSLYHGLGFAVGSILGGIIFDQAGLQVLYGVSAGVALVWGIVVALVGRFVPKKRRLHYSSLLHREEDDGEEGYLSDDDSDEVYGNDWLVKALKDDF
ncbi:major facilitator superfamily domain-containing protein 6-like protein B [Acanthaster planci]|uniref:Major facilitator superfamily domain-containing protein 6-like protein B n=1 Tax=Acanthaster planci TaxID=133434 RepID=A0A8B7ZBV1_ACAPL|nr:major facilitator superfamily domain-containing protein 6-like protein B [Acanthaster planci]